MRDEVSRKALHLLALVVPAGIAWLGRETSLLVLIPLSLLGLAGDVLRVRVESFRRGLHVVFGRLMRPEEIPPLGGRVHINGATWVLLSATALLLVFPVRLVVPVFTMFMLSDAAAALVGRRLGRTPWPGSHRTLEGSAAFLITGLPLMLIFPDVVYWIAAIGVVAGMLAEVAPRPLNDNMRVPFVAACVIWALEHLMR